MNFGSRVLASWRLGWSGLRVILKDKTLLGFPAVTIAAILSILSLVYIVIGPNLQVLVLAAVTDATAPDNGTFYYTLLLAWYFMLAFVAVAMHVALVGAIDISMNERDSKFRDGISIAMQFIPSIITWTLINYSVGFILTLLDQQRHTSKLVRMVLGTAWSIITFLAIPVMVVEKLNIFSALSRSSKLMEKTWGQNLHPGFGLGYFFLLLNIPLVIFCTVNYFQEGEASVSMDLLGTMYFLLTLVMVQASRSVLMVALFEYAATGKVPQGFEEDFLRSAFITWDAATPVAPSPEPVAPSPEPVAAATESAAQDVKPE